MGTVTDFLSFYSMLLFLLKVIWNLSKNVKLVAFTKRSEFSILQFMKFNMNGANTVWLFRISPSCCFRGFQN